MTRRLLALSLAAFAGACSNSSSAPPPPPPAPVILSPHTGALLGSAATGGGGYVTFSGTATAGASVVVQVGNLGVCQVAAQPDGAWSCTSTALGEGVKQARAIATNANGPSPLSAAVDFTIDLTRPAKPTLGTSPVATNAVSFPVAGTAEANASVGLYVDSQFQTTVAVAANGAFQGTVTLPGVDGPAGITAVAQDAAKNLSDPSAVTTITVDRTAPAVPVVIAPEAGAHLAAADLTSGKVAVSGTAEVGARVEVLIDGVFVATVTADGNGFWAANVPLASSARYQAGARAVDPVGNRSGAATSAFTLSLARTAAPATVDARVTIWGQTGPDLSGLGEVFAGQANSWVIDGDFSLAREMWGSQFASALQLLTGAPSQPVSVDNLTFDVLYGTTLAPFPRDQAISELTWLSPRFTPADGVVTAAASDGATMGLAALQGAASGFLNGTSDSRLSRTLSFDPGSVYTIAWVQQAEFWPSSIAGADAPPFGPLYQVVLRDPANGMAQIGDPLYATSLGVVFDPGFVESVTIAGSLVPGGQAVLSFELRAPAQSYAEIDGLVVLADGAPVALANPGFEAGLTGWTANAGSELQNVSSGTRTLVSGGQSLDVTRTVYAPPGATWARVVDVFANRGGVPISTSAVYATILGGGVPLSAVTRNGACVVGWDGDPAGATARDVGFVLGNGTAYVAADPAAPDPGVYFVHDLAVAPGEAAALVHFVVQLGEATGGLTRADVPVNTDAACGEIAAGFPASDVYWQDLGVGIMEIIRNF